MVEVVFVSLLGGGVVWWWLGRKLPVRPPLLRRSPTLDNTSVTFAHRGKK